MIDLRANLVGYWKLNDSSLSSYSVLDSSVSANNGVSQRYTANLASSGKVLGAFTFDNTIPDRVNIGNQSELNFGLNTSFTVCLWAKVTARTGNDYDTLLCKGDANYGYAIMIGATGWWIFLWDTDEYPCINFGTDALLGDWHFFAFVIDRDNTVLKAYLDGTFVGSPVSIATLGTLSNTGNFVLGDYSDLGYPFKGLLDNVMVFNKALNEDELDFLCANNSGTERVYEVEFTFDSVGIEPVLSMGVNSDVKLSGTIACEAELFSSIACGAKLCGDDAVVLAKHDCLVTIH